jgi:hypothetical protein
MFPDEHIADFADVYELAQRFGKELLWSAQQRSTRESIRKCLQRC